MIERLDLGTTRGLGIHARAERWIQIRNAKDAPEKILGDFAHLASTLCRC
jgi:hypothetical protein